MPLPLPNLDTRRWSDLVEEGRALIPRHAARWSDVNVHDPGMTLLELLAWISEQFLYRANRIPERYLRKYLALLGFTPRPPAPAGTVVAWHLVAGSGSQIIPEGVVLRATRLDGTTLDVRTRRGCTALDTALMAVQVFDGREFRDQSQRWREALPFQPFGPDPAGVADAASSPALYLGFDTAIPAAMPATLHVVLEHGREADEETRRALAAELAEMTAACSPDHTDCRPCPTPDDEWCPPVAPAPAPPGDDPDEPAALREHHSARVVWEYLAADGWHRCEPAAEPPELDDRTRALTLGGPVTLTLRVPTAATALGRVAQPLHYLRCRLVAGRHDASPIIHALALNAVPVEQAVPQLHTYTLAAGAVVPGALTVGERQRLAVRLGADYEIEEVAIAADEAAVPATLVVSYAPGAGGGARSLTLDRVPLASCVEPRTPAHGTGLPEQCALLHDAPVTRAAAELHTLGSGLEDWTAWTTRADLDASTPLDRHVVLDATTGEASFGDGRRGAVPHDGDALLARYDTTMGAAGNTAHLSFALLDHPLTTMALGNAAAVAALAANASVTALAPCDGGRDEESVGEAMRRAAALLWTHERLVELCPPGACTTLDQRDPAAVEAIDPPPRAVTLLDYERIARNIPGTRLARVRAWAGVDPSVPCASVPGTVTLVIVPYLPLGQPEPTRGLRRTVWRYLERRRVLGTRVVVTGPCYVEVAARATVRATERADHLRVAHDVEQALSRFLDPLEGGPAGRGWPFGRDVFRSEVLGVIDGVPGVDHVEELALLREGELVTCNNACIPPLGLAASGAHEIEVR